MTRRLCRILEKWCMRSKKSTHSKTSHVSTSKQTMKVTMTDIANVKKPYFFILLRSSVKIQSIQAYISHAVESNRAIHMIGHAAQFHWIVLFFSYILTFWCIYLASPWTCNVLVVSFLPPECANSQRLDRTSVLNHYTLLRLLLLLDTGFQRCGRIMYVPHINKVHQDIVHRIKR